MYDNNMLHEGNQTMTTYMKCVLLPGVIVIAAAMLLSGSPAWSMNPAEADITMPNRGPVALDDDCGDCMIDYTGLRWSGTGGQGGRGVIYWPGGSTGNNYGQMCFASTCEFADPLYAWCVDLYHPVETSNYGIDIFPAVVTDDSCRKTQLTAMAYLMAWNFPTSTFEDDALQLALWKLSSIRDGGDNDGLPHFCFDAGRGYPAFNDTPVYPFVNTVYGSNVPRNDWANSRVLEAIGKNVMLPGDSLTDTCEGPFIEGDTATVTLTFCVDRGELAGLVNDTCSENIKLNLLVQIGANDPELMTVYTDANGCITIDVRQPVENPQPVYVRLCTKSSWPVGLTGCDEATFDENQWLVLSLDPVEICFPFEFPGDKWLSVELASFDAYTTIDGVDLQWSTASESNAERWEVERCLTGSGQFELIAQIPAQNSATGATYQFADRNGVAGSTYDYRLIDIDVNGTRTVHQSIASARFGSLSGTVLEYSLADAYPNPFNPTTSISFSVPEASLVQLRIYDLSGREVASLVNGMVSAGQHSIEWNAENLPSGTYFYSLNAGNFTSTKKLMLLK